MQQLYKLVLIIVFFYFTQIFASAPTPLSFDHKSLIFTQTQSGHKLHYLVYTNNVNNPPILLLNGYGTMSYDWSPIFISDLSKKFTIYAVDYPGILSPKIDNFTFKRINKDLNDFIVHRVITQSNSKVNMLGWSFGSMVALTFLKQYGNRINYMYIVSGSPGFGHSIMGTSLDHKKVAKAIASLPSDSFTLMTRYRLVRLMFPKYLCGLGKIDNICRQVARLFHFNRKQYGAIHSDVLAQEDKLVNAWRKGQQGIPCHIVSKKKHICPVLSKPKKIVYIQGRMDYYNNYRNAIYMHEASDNSLLFLEQNAGHGIIYQMPKKIANLMIKSYQ